MRSSSFVCVQAGSLDRIALQFDMDVMQVSATHDHS